jgi:hypothetical protein
LHFDPCWGNHASMRRHVSEFPDPWITLRWSSGVNRQTTLQTWLI